MHKRKHVFQRYISAALVSALCMAQCTVPTISAQDAVPDFSYLSSVGDFSAEEVQTFCASIYEQLAAGAETIEIETGYSINTSQLSSIQSMYSSIVSSFDVGILIAPHYIHYYIEGTTLYISPTYLVDTDEYSSTYKAMIKKLDKITASVNDSWSDAEKALYIHDYLAKEFDYDYTDYSGADETALEIPHTAYGILSNGTAVCEGYAALYSMLMNRMGITCTMAKSDALGHAWNLICIDDSWYHVDVTWDDVYYLHPGLTRHNYFLKSSTALKDENHSSDDWTLYDGSSLDDLNISDKYDTDAFWDNTYSVVTYYDNQWLISAMGTDGAYILLCSLDTDTGESSMTPLIQLDMEDSRWYSMDMTGYFGGTFVVPADAADNRIYFSTPDAIYYLESAEDTEPKELLTLDSTQQAQGHIYGMKIENNILYYYVSETYISTPVEYSYELWFAEETTTTTEETTTTTEETTTTTEETTTTTEETTTTTEETTTTTEETTTTETDILLGDVNDDGKVSVQDIVYLQKYLLGSVSLEEKNFQLADVTQDNKLNVYDLILLKKILLKK